MKRSAWLLSLAPALLCLGADLGAQSRSGRLFARYTKPLRPVTLDLATGTVTLGLRPRDRAASTVLDFDNLDFAGFTGLDTGGGFCEWFDAGVKGTGTGRTAGVANDSDLMNSIVFSYCSAKLNTSSGGPGGATKLGFYEGYTAFGGAPSTGVAAMTLTGLPANSTSSSFFGGFTCYFIRVLFGSLVCFADGPIGYSWRFLDVGTGTLNPLGAVVAGTWPFLACVSSCSGTPSSGPDGQGMIDVIDEYCPPGYLRTVFTFASTSGSFTSVAMGIEEVSDCTTTVSQFNSATFPNPDVLAAVPAVVGQPWSASLTLGLGRSKSGGWICYFGTTRVNPPSGIPISPLQGGLSFGLPKAGRMLLCALNTSGFACVGAHSGLVGSVSTTNCGGGSLPKRIALVCNEWCAQAVVMGQPVAGGGNARLSSGISGTIGTN
jgi:hypothetical protein